MNLWTRESRQQLIEYSDWLTIIFYLLLAAHVGGWRPAAAPPSFWHIEGFLRVPNLTNCVACPRTPPACCSPWISVCNGTWHRSVGRWHVYEDTVINTARVARPVTIRNRRRSIVGDRLPDDQRETYNNNVPSSNGLFTRRRGRKDGNKIVIIPSSCRTNNSNIISAKWTNAN